MGEDTYTGALRAPRAGSADCSFGFVCSVFVSFQSIENGAKAKQLNAIQTARPPRLLLELPLVLLLVLLLYVSHHVLKLESLRAMHEIRWNFKRGPTAANSCMERLNKSFCRTLHDKAT